MVYTREQVIENSLKYFEGDDIASDVFCKYALKNKEDYYENSPSQMFDRLSGEFSRIEDKYIKNDKTYLPKQEIRELFDGFKYIVGQG